MTTSVIYFLLESDSQLFLLM